MGLQASGHLIITVAALEMEKGIQRVIDVMPKVLSVFPNAHYCVLGEGGYRQDLEQLIRSRHLENHVSSFGV